MVQRTTVLPLAPILRDRRFGLVLIGTLSLHAGLSSMNLPSWECPFFRLTGLPCPGCGLTRACLLLLRGEVQASIKFHAFAPIFILLIMIMIVTTLLPGPVTEPLIRKAESWEQHTRLTSIILGGLILYWLARLFLFPNTFDQLIRG